MSAKKLMVNLVAVCFALTLFAGTAAAEKVLKIGVLGPFTGPSAKTGEEFKGAVTMAFERSITRWATISSNRCGSIARAIPPRPPAPMPKPVSASASRPAY
jgi:hypothetical protein